MPIDVLWGNEQHTYVYIHVVGKWAWNEYHIAINSANQLINSVSHPVCIVTHLVDSQAQTLSRRAFSEWRKSIINTPKNLQTVILVPGRPIIQVFLDVAARMFSPFITFKFRMAPTREDAEKIVVTSVEVVSNGV